MNQRKNLNQKEGDKISYGLKCRGLGDSIFLQWEHDVRGWRLVWTCSLTHCSLSLTLKCVVLNIWKSHQNAAFVTNNLFFFRIKSMSNLDFFFFPSNFQLRWPVVVERSFLSFSFSFLVFSLRNFIDIHKEICINYEISREEWRKTSNQTIIKKFFS